MIYTVWGTSDLGELTLVSGELNTEENSDLKLIKTFEAESWEEAVNQYDRWVDNLEPIG